MRPKRLGNMDSVRTLGTPDKENRGGVQAISGTCPSAFEDAQQLVAVMHRLIPEDSSNADKKPQLPPPASALLRLQESVEKNRSDCRNVRCEPMQFLPPENCKTRSAWQSGSATWHHQSRLPKNCTRHCLKQHPCIATLF